MLVCGATKTVKRYSKSQNIGILFNPRKMNSTEIVEETRLDWAADNDAYNGFNPDEFTKMLDKISELPRCLFVVSPDSVGNAEETIELFNEWQTRIKERGLPTAFVGQDGLNIAHIPWLKIEAYFIGGTDKWKLTDQSFQIAREAKRRGKWVHMGRVNSAKRIWYAQQFNCDSIDGSGFSRFPDQKIPWALQQLRRGDNYLEGLLG